MADAISIEETNKVRVALGLKPLPVPGAGPSFKDESSSGSEDEEQGSTLESREALGFDNWKQLQAEQDAKRKRTERAEAIRKARETAQKLTRLEGKGLGEQDEADELDTRAWLVQQKKRQKKLEKERERARKVEEELRQREEQEYTAKDLAGVRVAHAANDFDEEGGEQVLTLKDTTIEENEEEGDELENLQLAEQERLNERLNVKKKKPAYNPNDVAEDGSTVLLQQYDEVIDGKKRKRFTLDVDGSTTQEPKPSEGAGGAGVRAKAISLDVLKDLPGSDYQEPAAVKIKKPKKKKDKSTQRKAVEEDDIFPASDANGQATNGDAMEVDGPEASSNATKKETTSFVDDEDLQSALAKQRRAALKQRKKTRPEDLARQIQDEKAEVQMENTEEPPEEAGLVIDETSDFVANLQRPELDRRPRGSASVPNGTASVPAKEESDDEDGDVNMDRSYADLDGSEAREVPASAEPPAGTGLEEEATLTRGVGAAFELLRKRNLVADSEADQLVAQQRRHQQFIREKRQAEEAAAARARQDRERGRASGRFERLSAREREEQARYENQRRDFEESQQLSRKFDREYQPHFRLAYKDEHGRDMTPKESFKHLSHQFHGKASGKQKTEKHLKKIAQERQREAQSNLDSGQGSSMNSAVGATAKKNKQAGVRLA